MGKIREFNEVLEAIKAVHEQTAQTLFELNDIVLRINPALERDWAIKVGCWETRLLEARLEAERAKRRCELAQAACNRGDAPDSEAIEANLDKSLSDWMDQLKTALDRYHDVLDFMTSATVLTSAQAAELKALYRKLVKRLHPDMVGSDSEKMRLFEALQAAYERGDLAMLRSLDVATEAAEDAPTAGLKNVEEANVELALREAQLALVQETLAKTKASEPYTLKALLDDPEWLARKASEMQSSIEECQRVRDAYDARYRELGGIHG